MDTYNSVIRTLHRAHKRNAYKKKLISYDPLKSDVSNVLTLALIADF